MLDSEIINEVITLLSDRLKHTTKHLAIDRHGNLCSLYSHDAVSWSLGGALVMVKSKHKVCSVTVNRTIRAAIKLLYNDDPPSIVFFDKLHGYNDVMLVLHKARELALQAEQSKIGA